MKIKYEFANEVIEIEVSDEWGMVILEMDRLDYNNDKKETRRHLARSQHFEECRWSLGAHPLCRGRNSYCRLCPYT